MQPRPLTPTLSPNEKAVGGEGANGRLPLFAIVVLVIIVYWPGVHGFWGRDDFMQLASARLVGSPWPLFVQDHYVPVPGAVFRPLGFASFWLGAALFGTDYEAHAIADMLLHLGVALALFGLLLRAAIPRLLAVCCALLFALHPAVVGTALWWSARFDLLAALFVLLALNAAFDYRERGRWTALLLALLAAFAAMLSKEVGLAVLVPLSWLWLRWAWHEPAQRAQALRAIALAWLCALAYFGWRWSVLGTPASGLTGTMPVSSAIAKGLLDWLQQAPGYLAFWARSDGARRGALVVAVLVLAMAVGAAIMRHPARGTGRRRVDLAVCGLCLLVVPALLQAPVAALNAAPLRADMSVIEAAMQSRLYYLGISGAAIALAALLAPVWDTSSTRWRIAIFVPLAFAAAALGSISHADARAFAKRSMQISTVARAAVAAVGELDLPTSRCHVVFLGIDPPPEWSIYVSMDSIVKALSPDLARVGHCYFHADYVTYFHLLAAPVDTGDAAPYRPLEIDGRIVPPRRIGGLLIDYLSPPPQVDPRELASMRFLRYRDGRFDDVSADVVAGRLAVRLR
ncbi:hypothetical protein [Dokdonella soli]|uniref:Glycosyltransferase RgtA/B/C/D-like domain-containing protein n=1 Tax=Dokdonella soli TaxID=529810 RepID=A0ABN1IBP0_9GAMM